jgi:5'-phosphate synthase pdxT subunit
VTVRRNAYGRQVDSFEADIPAPALGDQPVRAVFIRAPQVTRVGTDVEVLAEGDAGPVVVRQGSILGAAFHPELTGERRIHRLFVDMARERRTEKQ